MKYLIAFFASAFIMSACNNNTSESKDSEKATSTDSTKTFAAYACPMHPEITSDKPATCNMCGMDLEKTK